MHMIDVTGLWKNVCINLHTRKVSGENNDELIKCFKFSFQINVGHLYPEVWVM